MKVREFWKDVRGATAAEYALVMAVFVAGVGVASMMLGTSVHDGMASDASVYTSAELNPSGAAPGATAPGGGGGSGTGTPGAGGGAGTGGGTTGPGDGTSDPPGKGPDTPPGQENKDDKKK